MYTLHGHVIMVNLLRVGVFYDCKIVYANVSNNFKATQFAIIDILNIDVFFVR